MTQCVSTNLYIIFFRDTNLLKVGGGGGRHLKQRLIFVIKREKSHFCSSVKQTGSGQQLKTVAAKSKALEEKVKVEG